MAEKVAELFGTEDEHKAEPTPAPVTETKVEAPPVVVAPTPEPLKPVEAPKQPEPGHVPLAAMLDEREKRQKLETQLAALQAERLRPQTIPSVQDDPEAFAAHIRETAQRIAVDERFNISQTIAEEKHGADVVKAAMDWGMERAQQNSVFAAEYVKQKHPIDWAVRQHKREKLVSSIGDDEEAYVRRRFAELNPANPAAPQTQPQAAPAAPQPVAQQATPRPSLASAPSAGGLQTQVVPKDKVLDRLGLDG